MLSRYDPWLPLLWYRKRVLKSSEEQMQICSDCGWLGFYKSRSKQFRCVTCKQLFLNGCLPQPGTLSVHRLLLVRKRGHRVWVFSAGGNRPSWRRRRLGRWQGLSWIRARSESFPSDLLFVASHITLPGITSGSPIFTDVWNMFCVWNPFTPRMRESIWPLFSVVFITPGCYS